MRMGCLEPVRKASWVPGARSHGCSGIGVTGFLSTFQIPELAFALPAAVSSSTSSATLVRS